MPCLFIHPFVDGLLSYRCGPLHLALLFLIFLRYHHAVSIVIVAFYFLSKMHKVPTSPALIIFFVFNRSHPNGFKVIFHCGFLFWFVFLVLGMEPTDLMISDIEYLFPCLLAFCLSSLENCLFKFFGFFFSLGTGVWTQIFVCFVLELCL